MYRGIVWRAVSDCVCASYITDYLGIVASHDRQHPVRSEVLLREVERLNANARKSGVRTASTRDVAWSSDDARE
jgi:hypothetical protein